MHFSGEGIYNIYEQPAIQSLANIAVTPLMHKTLKLMHFVRSLVKLEGKLYTLTSELNQVCIFDGRSDLQLFVTLSHRGKMDFSASVAKGSLGVILMFRSVCPTTFRGIVCLSPPET